MALKTLFSETDKHGRITFANDAFCEVSQYSRPELIGRPHNIIRHPEMPSKLFEHLWATIQRGQVFHGVIKNRAKDGTSYWVNATIKQMVSRDNVITYSAIRHLITDEAQALQLYADQIKLLSLK